MNAASEPHLSLGEVLNAPQFGLELLAGDPRALDRPVLGAHVVEIAEPSRWVPQDWLMLTNGLRVRDRAREQVRLIDEVADHRLTALAWSVGTVDDDVPRAARDAAERRGFPLIRVPLHTPFRDIVLFVNQTLLSTDAYLFRRLQRMQTFLVDALGADDPEQEIVRRLASLLHVDVLLYRADGRLIARAGRAPDDVVWNALDRTGASTFAGAAGDWHFAGEPVGADGLVVRWLVCAGRSLPGDDRLTRPLLQHAVQLLGLLSGVSRFEERRERERRAAVLRTALSSGADAVALEEEAKALGLAPGGGALQVASCHLGAAANAGTALAALEAELRRLGIPWLLAADDEQVAVVLQCDDGTAYAVLDAALRHVVSARAGLGEPVAGLGDVGRALAEARLAVTAIRPRKDQRVVHVRDVDPATWLLAAAPRAVYERKFALTLSPLRAHPPLLETLRCYFECDLSVSRAARRLFLHPNSLRYRLTRVEELLDASLRAPQTIANVHLALLHEATAGTEAGGGEVLRREPA